MIRDAVELIYGVDTHPQNNERSLLNTAYTLTGKSIYYMIQPDAVSEYTFCKRANEALPQPLSARNSFVD